LVREAAGGGEKAFELEVSAEGLALPSLEGSSIMATSIANVHAQYVFIVGAAPARRCRWRCAAGPGTSPVSTIR
jgi:hypothetical protein